MPMNLFNMPSFPTMKAMPQPNREVPAFCDELNTITLDNKGGDATKFIDGIELSDGRVMNIMASTDKKTCIRNDVGKIHNVIGVVKSSGAGNTVNIGLLLI